MEHVYFCGNLCVRSGFCACTCTSGYSYSGKNDLFLVLKKISHESSGLLRYPEPATESGLGTTRINLSGYNIIWFKVLTQPLTDCDGPIVCGLWSVSKKSVSSHAS